MNCEKKNVPWRPASLAQTVSCALSSKAQPPEQSNSHAPWAWPSTRGDRKWNKAWFYPFSYFNRLGNPPHSLTPQCAWKQTSDLKFTRLKMSWCLSTQGLWLHLYPLVSVWELLLIGGQNGQIWRWRVRATNPAGQAWRWVETAWVGEGKGSSRQVKENGRPSQQLWFWFNWTLHQSSGNP